MRTTKTSYLILACLAVWTAIAADKERPKITVLLYDYSHAHDSVTPNAVVNAREIFRHAGIRSEFKSPHRNRQYPPDTLTLQIFNGKAKNAEFGNAAGAAMGTITANIFYGNVEAHSRDSEHASALLAYVMVHELAHLLGLNHTNEGIMAPDFKPEQRQLLIDVRLAFTKNEASQLLAAIAARQNAR